MADRTVTINKIKGVGSLTFQVPASGVHVITGLNGCGKTTLMACLQRLSWSNAFQWYFKTSQAPYLDDFTGTISYEHANRKVTYSYGTAKWAPSPRSHKDVLNNFGFNDVKFISTASSERFYVQEKDLTTQRIDQAHQFIKDRMNRIFGSNKYINLRKTRVNTSRRRGATARDNVAYIIPKNLSNRPIRYYSEKNFSLGEILILNMLEQLQVIRNNSLLLIDEIELALHPKVQIELYKILVEMAAQKNLTVLISTHSTSLIKNARNLIFLNRLDKGEIEVKYKCSPAFALGVLAYDEDLVPDAVFYVEDRNGKVLMREMLDYFWKRNPQLHKKDVRTVYVGGYREVVEMMNQSRGYLFHANLRTKAFLDADVQSDTIPSLSATDSFIVRYNQLRNNIEFLPCTPELGLCELLETNTSQHDAALSGLFGVNGINLGSVFSTSEYTDFNNQMTNAIGQIQSLKALLTTASDRGAIERQIMEKQGSKRKLAKKKVWHIVEYLKTKTNEIEDNILRNLFNHYVNEYYSNSTNYNQLQASIGRAIN